MATIFILPSDTENSYGRLWNSGFLSLISVTRMLTVADEERPPSSSALISCKTKIIINLDFRQIGESWELRSKSYITHPTL